MFGRIQQWGQLGLLGLGSSLLGGTWLLIKHLYLYGLFRFSVSSWVSFGWHSQLLKVQNIFLGKKKYMHTYTHTWVQEKNDRFPVLMLYWVFFLFQRVTLQSHYWKKKENTKRINSTIKRQLPSEKMGQGNAIFKKEITAEQLNTL
jgi:hypothetical protein